MTGPPVSRVGQIFANPFGPRSTRPAKNQIFRVDSPRSMSRFGKPSVSATIAKVAANDPSKTELDFSGDSIYQMKSSEKTRELCDALVGSKHRVGRQGRERQGVAQRAQDGDVAAREHREAQAQTSKDTNSQVFFLHRHTCNTIQGLNHRNNGEGIILVIHWG